VTALQAVVSGAQGGVLADGARSGDGAVVITFVRALVVEPTFTGRGSDVREGRLGRFDAGPGGGPESRAHMGLTAF
jgi:hypothetical protein